MLHFLPPELTWILSSFLLPTDIYALSLSSKAYYRLFKSYLYNRIHVYDDEVYFKKLLYGLRLHGNGDSCQELLIERSSNDICNAELSPIIRECINITKIRFKGVTELKKLQSIYDVPFLRTIELDYNCDLLWRIAVEKRESLPNLQTIVIGEIRPAYLFEKWFRRITKRVVLLHIQELTDTELETDGYANSNQVVELVVDFFKTRHVRIDKINVVLVSALTKLLISMPESVLENVRECCFVDRDGKVALWRELTSCKWFDKATNLRRVRFVFSGMLTNFDFLESLSRRGVEMIISIENVNIDLNSKLRNLVAKELRVILLDDVMCILSWFKNIETLLIICHSTSLAPNRNVTLPHFANCMIDLLDSPNVKVLKDVLKYFLHGQQGIRSFTLKYNSNHISDSKELNSYVHELGCAVFVQIVCKQ